MTTQTFEVRVNVKRGGMKYYSPKLSAYVADEMVKMYHYDRRSAKQALRAASKHGRPISVRKADVARITGVGNIEKIELRVKEVKKNNAIAMDELVFKKRNIRRKNLYRDKLDNAD